MSRKWMWIILSGMTIALLGIVSIQAYWINYSVRLNQAKFDQSVRIAVNNIAASIERTGRQALQSIGVEKMRELQRYGLSNDFRRKQLLREFNDVQNLLGIIDINELIDARFINHLVKVELENRGIRLDYNYGVYSTKREAFVIIDGVNQYVAPLDSVSSGADIEIEAGNALYDAHFKAKLFPSFYGSRAIFMLHFPNRTSAGWNESWLLLVGSIIFIGLILVVFAYTFFTILQQKKLSEMKNDFINNMTHEFKTPIATISLATDSLSSPKIQSFPERVKHFAKVIKQENNRMLKQVEKVLQMAVVDKRNFSLQFTEVNVHSLIEQAIENQSLKIEKRKGKIEHEFYTDSPIIEADETHISNIIHNLLENAEKYSEKSPHILVKTYNEGDEFYFSIRDYGIGMSADEQEHVFDKFYRVQSGNIHDVKGFGLGLSYVKAIVSAHDGNIEVDSRKGKGTTFTVSLPYHQD